ncbi:thermonuclease family protein [Melaminivora jejuensis]|uniref:thermonuclease family protein n=1 Tax=Melaminivora jejuensis TaxID=1267217 RepID=UPI001ADF95F4|nr:thermonuclease family protein [Melaminivora jejuensis]UHJ66159.1 thermonuclease family protein [Melaminivora jejuensis]
MSTAALLCLVIAVSDGDTLTVRCAARRPERVRIVAIDAPELRQAFGRQARENLKRLCFRQRAELHTLGRDAYGRHLARVRCAGQDVATAQVAAGLAWLSTRQPAQYRDLAALQARAQAARIGLWSQARPMAPWDYRRRYPAKR